VTAFAVAASIARAYRFAREAVSAVDFRKALFSGHLLQVVGFDAGPWEQLVDATGRGRGHVHLLKGASWLAEFLIELLAFPNGRHDDQVDSVSQFLRWWQNAAYANRLPIVMPFFFSTRRYFPT